MRDKIYDELKKVIDPELGCDIVSLGLIYSVEIDAGRAKITMTLSARACPLHELILGWVKEAGERVMGADKCEVDLVWEPEWSIEMASEEVRAKFS